MEIYDIKWKYAVSCTVKCDCGNEFFDLMVENFYGTFLPFNHICGDCGKKYVYKNIEIPLLDSNQIRIKAVK